MAKLSATESSRLVPLPDQMLDDIFAQSQA
jgi:hypothetical protein